MSHQISSCSLVVTQGGFITFVGRSLLLLGCGVNVDGVLVIGLGKSTLNEMLILLVDGILYNMYPCFSSFLGFLSPLSCLLHISLLFLDSHDESLYW